MNSKFIKKARFGGRNRSDSKNCRVFRDKKDN
jgi:hypothetical protein